VKPEQWNSRRHMLLEVPRRLRCQCQRVLSTHNITRLTVGIHIVMFILEPTTEAYHIYLCCAVSCLMSQQRRQKKPSCCQDSQILQPKAKTCDPLVSQNRRTPWGLWTKWASWDMQQEQYRWQNDKTAEYNINASMQ